MELVMEYVWIFQGSKAQKAKVTLASGFRTISITEIDLAWQL